MLSSIITDCMRGSNLAMSKGVGKYESAIGGSYVTQSLVGGQDRRAQVRSHKSHRSATEINDDRNFKRPQGCAPIQTTSLTRTNYGQRPLTNKADSDRKFTSNRVIRCCCATPDLTWMTSFGRFFDTVRKSALQRRPCVTSKLPHAGEQTFAKQILVRIYLVAQKLLRTMLFAEIPMVQGIKCSGCPAERAISLAMHDPTMHIDGLVVCSLLRNAKTTATLYHLAQVQCGRKWLKELPAVISGCNIASALFTNYCVLCMGCDTSRALWPGCPRMCPGWPTAQSRGELGS